MELAEEISDEYLTCSICLDPYTEPKQLPCLHSFCKKCLSDHIANNVPRGKMLSFTCPVCRKATKPANPNVRRLREWADTFPNNFFILGLMETLNTRSSRSVMQNVRKLSEASENCTKHPELKCDSYCTLKRIGVCDKCSEDDHKDCGVHHLTAQDAAGVTDRKLGEFKVQMEKLRADVEKIREAFELSKPRELRLQKEELALKISEHFSELKSMFIKSLIQKEKRLGDQLNEIIEKEKSGMSDSVDECSSLIKSFNGMVDLFDKLMTSCPINALTALYNMEEQMASYSKAVGTLQSTSEKPPIEFVPVLADMEQMLSTVKIGEIRTKDKKIHVKLNADDVVEEEEPKEEPHEEPELDDTGSYDDNGSYDETGSSEDASATDESESDHFAGASAPPLSPLENVPYSLQGFASISLEPAKPWETGRRNQNRESQRTSYYNPSSPTSLTPNARPRSLQDRAANDIDVSLWRNVAFFGNLTYSERRGGLGGITAMTRNLCAVADRFNNSIKVISIKGKIVNTLTFGNMDPWDITFDKSFRQLVVTCPNQSFIVFVAEDSNSNSYYINNTVQTKQYTSISCIRTNAYIVGVCRPHGSPRVDVINSNGSVLSYIDAQVQYPRSLEALSDGKLVICDWTKKEVIVVGFGGGANHHYQGVQGGELKDPMGLTKDSSGNIYVLDHRTRKVHVLNGRTGNCRTVVPLEGVQDPRMICIVDSSRSAQSLVVLDSQNGVHVFSIDVPAGQTLV